MSQADRDILALSGIAPQGRFTRALPGDALRLATFAPIIAMILWDGTWYSPAFDLMHAVIAVIGAQALVAWARGRRIETGGLVTALAFTLLLPAGTPVLHLMLGAVFGAVLGEAIFGGRGHSFVNPAVVGLAFVHFSAPGADLPFVAAPFWAAALGAAVLLALGLSDWRTSAAALTALGLAGLVAGQGAWPWSDPMAGTAVFVVVFLAADIASAPLTRGARLAAGLMLAGLALLLEPGAGLPGPRALIFAALLTAVFAPLLDSAALALHDALDRRRRRV